ncbi:MAG: ABC transporter permease [Burkholderiaceae bacterium]|nr:ABC transporter permease [Burkholderiaceae bacterium]
MPERGSIGMPGDPQTPPAQDRRLELASTAEGQVLSLHGDWRLRDAESIWQALAAIAPAAPLAIRAGELTGFDSAGALLLLRALERAGLPAAQIRWLDFGPEHARILDGVRRRYAELAAAPTDLGAARAGASPLAALGRQTVEVGALLHGHLGFFGAALAALAEAFARPRKLRVKELAAQFEQVCLNAVPVVALVTLLIGVTIAYLLGLQAEKYGANIFVVDGVAIGMTREFAPIIVATIVAGRSGAAFTAQLGSMRLTEEIDAIRTLGLSPLQVLVVPRVLALMVALPLLVFVGDALGIAGAMLVADPLLGLTPATFLERLRDALDLKHFWIGLAKAPVFALFIAVIGCRMGMTVGRDTRAVGLATTSTVVQSIVSVILLDAAFAVLFQELGL